MPLKCCVSSCKLQSDDPYISGVSFHKLPARDAFREAWLEILKDHCSRINLKYSCVCSRHFKRECFQYSGLCERRMLKRGSVPTIFSDFESVTCEEHSVVSPKLDPQNNSDESTPCDSFSLPNEDTSCLQEENEHSAKWVKIEPDCPSISESIEIQSDEAYKDNVLRPNPPENMHLNNAGDDEKTTTEKQLRNKISMLQQRNRNLTKQLIRCRNKMLRFKFLFQTLRRQIYRSHNQRASLRVDAGISISK